MAEPALWAGSASQRWPVPKGRWPPPKKKVYNGKWDYLGEAGWRWVVSKLVSNQDAYFGKVSADRSSVDESCI